ncbi:MAG: hypothetical protein DI537_46570 [Stutzerimonas stutzeri]|nr:MAG: hypothetical protein DI537_46570 [Stutzerimonas stutzeri]
MNYEIEGLCTMLPMFTSKEEFLDMANNTQAAPLAFAAAERRYAAPAGTTINIDAQTDEQRNFLNAVKMMKEDK